MSGGRSSRSSMHRCPVRSSAKVCGTAGAAWPRFLPEAIQREPISDLFSMRYLLTPVNRLVFKGIGSIGTGEIVPSGAMRAAVL